MLASLSQQSFRVDVSSSSSREDIGCDANIGALTLTENTEAGQGATAFLHTSHDE